MENKAHIKIDKVVEYCSDCPLCDIRCTGYGKSGCYEYDLICKLRGITVHTSLQYLDICLLSSDEFAKDFVPDDCLMKI